MRIVEVWADSLVKDPGTLYFSVPGANGTTEFWFQFSEMVDHLLGSIGSLGEWKFGQMFRVQEPIIYQQCGLGG